MKKQDEKFRVGNAVAIKEEVRGGMKKMKGSMVFDERAVFHIVVMGEEMVTIQNVDGAFWKARKVNIRKATEKDIKEYEIKRLFKK